MKRLRYYLVLIFLLTSTVMVAQVSEFTGHNDIYLTLVTNQIKYQYISEELKGNFDPKENQFEFFVAFNSFKNENNEVAYFENFIRNSNTDMNTEELRITVPIEDPLIDLSKFEGEHLHLKAIVSFGDVHYISPAAMVGYYTDDALIYSLTVETKLSEQLEYELLQTYLPADLNEIHILIKDARMIDVLQER